MAKSGVVGFVIMKPFIVIEPARVKKSFYDCLFRKLSSREVKTPRLMEVLLEMTQSCDHHLYLLPSLLALTLALVFVHVRK